MSHRANLGTVIVRGVRLDLTANTDGAWTLTLLGEGEQRRTLAQASDLKNAKAAAARALRKMDVTVAVPFRYHDGLRAVADRMSVTGKALVQLPNGGRDELTYQDRSKTLKPDTPDQVIVRLTHILDTMRELGNERDAIRKEWGYDVLAATRAAVDELARTTTDSWTPGDKQIAEESAT